MQCTTNKVSWTSFSCRDIAWNTSNVIKTYRSLYIHIASIILFMCTKGQRVRVELVSPTLASPGENYSPCGSSHKSIKQYWPPGYRNRESGGPLAAPLSFALSLGFLALREKSNMIFWNCQRQLWWKSCLERDLNSHLRDSGPPLYLLSYRVNRDWSRVLIHFKWKTFIKVVFGSVRISCSIFLVMFLWGWFFLAFPCNNWGYCCCWQ